MLLSQLYVGLFYILQVCVAALYGTRNAAQMLEISKEGYCTVLLDPNDIQNLQQVKHWILEDEEFKLKFNKCFNTNYRKSYSLIYPGTLWCGIGNIASNFTELGSFDEVDRCCRQHDLCSRYINSCSCKYNICNFSLFPYSHCDCDLKFRECLYNVSSWTSELIAHLYFNTLETPCFAEHSDSPECPVSEQTEANCQVGLRTLRYSWYDRWLGTPLGKIQNYTTPTTPLIDFHVLCKK